MWRETYDAVVRECGERPSGVGAAERLLTAVLEKVDVTALAAKAQLSAIGRELTRPLRQVLAVDSKTPRDEKLCRFQLQAVCRLLLCCEDGVFHAVGREDAPAQPLGKKKKKKEAGSKKTKPNKSKLPAKADVYSELCELLDRVALLIDSANPPSIADSEDEPSPFHTFLINVLEKRLGSLLPDVFTAIREVYELTEDLETETTGLTIRVSEPKEEKPTTEVTVVDSSSILSALKDVRPSKKRSLAATSDAFKEVILPGQPSKSTKLKSTASKPSSTHIARPSSHPSQSKQSKRPAADLSLVSLAAASKKSKPSRPTSSLLPKAMPLPMLVRNVDRQMLPARSAGISAPVPGPTNFSGANGLQRQPQTTRPSPSQLSRASVVMRTPDRPQRVQRSQPRILVEASPPLRNPFATMRIRRPGSQMPK